MPKAPLVWASYQLACKQRSFGDSGTNISFHLTPTGAPVSPPRFAHLRGSLCRRPDSQPPVLPVRSLTRKVP